MDEDEEARIRQVFDDHASEAIGKGGMTYVSEELVLKALRELGLTPKEGAIRKLMEDGAEDVVDYVKFRKLYFLAKEQYEVLPEDVSLALNVFSNGGILDMAGFESVMAEIDGGLSKAEIDELLFEGRNELFGAGAKKGAAISVDQFASFLLKRHAEAKSLMSVDGERGQSERLAMPDEEEVRYAKAQVASLRNLRHDEQLEREQGFPSRSEETQSLTSSWLKDSHVRLLSYKGPGDGADRLLELSDAMVELEDAHRVSLGFYTVQFVRSDALAGSSTALVMALSIEDFTVGDVRRLVAEQMSLEVSNTVFTVSKPETDNPLILAGDLSEPCGGSFLTHLFKLLSVQGQPGPATKPTHAVTVYRQPDIVNIRHSNMGVPITNDLLLPAFDAGDVTTLTKTIGCEGEGAPATLRPSDEPLNYSNNGNVLLFADRYDGPGDSRLASIPTTITAEIAKLTLHQSPKRRIIVVKINAPGTAGKTFNFRCGLIINTAPLELPNKGRPLALYQSRSLSERYWTGFSCRSTPVMVDVGKSGFIQKVLVEFHEEGLYYISDAEVELIIDENHLDGRINRKFEADGKPKTSGGRRHIRPWGWSRKGLLMQPWNVETTPAIMYYGNELEPCEWMLAPRKKGHHNKISKVRTAGRSIDHPREEWRPRGVPEDQWETWHEDSGKTLDTLFLTPSLLFAVHRGLFQYYSLLLSCDVKRLRETAETACWLSVPPHPDGKSMLKFSVMCYTDPAKIEDVDHPFCNVLPSLDPDYKGLVQLEARVPVSRCRPVGLLLRKYTEPPENRLRSQIATLLDSYAQFDLQTGQHVMVRNQAVVGKENEGQLLDAWRRGVLESITPSGGVLVSVGAERPAVYSYITPDFDSPVLKRPILALNASADLGRSVATLVGNDQTETVLMQSATLGGRTMPGGGETVVTAPSADDGESINHTQTDDSGAPASASPSRTPSKRLTANPANEPAAPPPPLLKKPSAENKETCKCCELM